MWTVQRWPLLFGFKNISSGFDGAIPALREAERWQVEGLPAL